jgi:hypothetical protein
MLGMEVRTAAATAQAVRAPALPRPASQQHHQAALVSPNTRIWSAVGFAAVRVSARAAAVHSPLCPAFHTLIWQQQKKGAGWGVSAEGLSALYE